MERAAWFRPSVVGKRDRIRGTPLGHLEVVDAQLRVTTEKHQTLLGRMDDVQSAWPLLQCASARANCLLRGVWPQLVRSSAERLANILNLSGNWDVATKDFASLPLSLADQPSSFLGGLGRLVGHDQKRGIASWETPSC